MLYCVRRPHRTIPLHARRHSRLPRLDYVSTGAGGRTNVSIFDSIACRIAVECQHTHTHSPYICQTKSKSHQVNELETGMRTEKNRFASIFVRFFPVCPRSQSVVWLSISREWKLEHGRQSTLNSFRFDGLPTVDRHQIESGIGTHYTGVGLIWIHISRGEKKIEVARRKQVTIWWVQTCGA